MVFRVVQQANNYFHNLKVGVLMYVLPLPFQINLSSFFSNTSRCKLPQDFSEAGRYKLYIRITTAKLLQQILHALLFMLFSFILLY